MCRCVVCAVGLCVPLGCVCRWVVCAVGLCVRLGCVSLGRWVVTVALFIKYLDVDPTNGDESIVRAMG